jgi:hypothetical protein
VSVVRITGVDNGEGICVLMQAEEERKRYTEKEVRPIK